MIDNNLSTVTKKCYTLLVLVSKNEHQTDFKTVEMLETFISFKVVSETSSFLVFFFKTYELGFLFKLNS